MAAFSKQTMGRDVIRVAHVITIYRGAVGILEAKLVALDSYPDLDVTVITGPNDADVDLPKPRIRVLTIPMSRHISPAEDLKSIWELSRVLRRERFDIVHTHSAKAGMIGALAAWVARVPVILHTYHGLPFYEGQSRGEYAAYRLLEKLACRFRDHVFSQNRRDMAECAWLMGTAERVHYEGNGVNVEELRRRAEKDIGRALMDFPPGELRVVLVSRLERVKRVDDFLRACSLLVSRGIDLAAVIAGYGPLEQDIRAMIEAMGLGRRVRLLGWAPHAPSLLKAADVVALTSEKEGIPRSLIEAMALGKPVVATDVLGTQELVVDGETGFLTPFRDPGALADRIEALHRDRGLAQRMGEAGRLRVEIDFNDVKIAAFLRDFYLKCCRRRAGLAGRRNGPSAWTAQARVRRAPGFPSE